MRKQEKFIFAAACFAVAIAAGPADAGQPIEGRLSAFLGEPKLEMQPLFDVNDFPTSLSAPKAPCWLLGEARE